MAGDRDRSLRRQDRLLRGARAALRALSALGLLEVALAAAAPRPWPRTPQDDAETILARIESFNEACLRGEGGNDDLLGLVDLLPRLEGHADEEQAQRMLIDAAEALGNDHVLVGVAWQLVQGIGKEDWDAAFAELVDLEPRVREPEVAFLWTRLAAVAVHVRRYEEAVDWAKRVLEAPFPPTDQVRFEAHLWLAEAYLGLGLPDQALIETRELSAPASELGEDYAALATKREIDLLLALHRYEEAVLRARRALDTRETPDVREQLGAAYTLMGEDDDAIEVLRPLALGEASEARVSARVRMAEIHSWHGRSAEALELLPEAGEIPENRLEVRALAAITWRRVAPDEPPRFSLDETFDRMLGVWDETRVRPTGLGFLDFLQRRELVIECARARCDDEGPEAALEVLYRAQLRGSLVRALDDEPVPSFEAARPLLTAPRRGLLVLLPGRRRGLVAAADSRDVVLAEWLTSRELDLLSAEWVGTVERGGEVGDELGARLERLLPGEVRDKLSTWDEVAVVGSDLARELLLELLPLGGTSLGERLAVSFLPSLPLGAWLARRAGVPSDPGPGLDALLVAAPATGHVAGAEPLPFDAARRARLLRDADPDRIRLLAGREATCAGVEAALREHPRVLGLVVHGVPDGSPIVPGTALLLAAEGKDEGAGLVGREQLASWSVPPVVVLAVCRGARGPRRPGDDVGPALVATLLRAGASSVVLAPFELEYEPALDLVGGLLAELESGASVAEAVRRASASGETRARRTLGGLLRVYGLGSLRPF